MTNYAFLAQKGSFRKGCWGILVNSEISPELIFDQCNSQGFLFSERNFVHADLFFSDVNLRLILLGFLFERNTVQNVSVVCYVFEMCLGGMFLTGEAYFRNFTLYDRKYNFQK